MELFQGHCVLYALRFRGAEPLPLSADILLGILILGATGGRLDHTFANFTLLGDFKQRGINITILDDYHKIYTLKDEAHNVQKNNRFLSIFALGGFAEVTLEGVFYPLNRYKLSPFQSMGVSNEITDPNAKITVTDGTLLVMEVSKEAF